MTKVETNIFFIIHKIQTGTEFDVVYMFLVYSKLIGVGVTLRGLIVLLSLIRSYRFFFPLDDLDFILLMKNSTFDISSSIRYNFL